MDLNIVLTMFWLKCLVHHLNTQPKQNKLPDKLGEKNVVSDLAISTHKYLKLSHKKKRNINQSTSLLCLHCFMLFLTYICA